MDKKNTIVSGYEITSDENFMRTIYPVPRELDIQLNDLYLLATKGKQSSVKKFLRLIEKYPRIPALKNYLSVLYVSMGNVKKSWEVNHWIVAEHPEYLFGKLNMAAEYFENEEYHKIPEILGEGMELKSLSPQRGIFHISEFCGFLRIATLYFCAIGDLEQAKSRLDILRETAPDSDDIELAEKYFLFAKMKKEREDAIEVEVNKTILTNIESPPEFYHKEITLLYAYDFYLDKKIINEILKLPRQSLIEDLNKVLDDSIVRFNYFKTKADSGDFDDETHNFVLHAIFMLSEIEATESIENILQVLRQDKDYIELYIGDIITEYMWLVLYKTGASNLEACKRFMFEPGIYTYSKSSVSEMAKQLIQHQPKRKEEIIEWYRDVFMFFINSSLNDNVIDSDLMGILVNDVLDFNGIALLPEIEQLYEKGFVDLYACGDIEDVKKQFADNSGANYYGEIESIFDIYDKIKSWGSDNSNDDPEWEDNTFDDRDKLNPPNQEVNATKKPGRNDPCPCGSGKKYKKCCMNKYDQ